MENPNGSAGFTEEAIPRWCGLFAQAANSLGSVYYVGSLAAPVVDEFRRAGIPVVGYEPGASFFSQPDSIASGVACDVLIIQQQALGGLLETSPQEFYRLFGSPRQVFLVLMPEEGEPVLPAASQWLWQMGFGRDFTVELWLDDRLLTVAYCPEMRHGDAVAMYEAECWRLALLSQKRRFLVLEYLQEYLREMARADHYRMLWENLKNQPAVRIMRAVSRGARMITQLPRALLKR